MNLKEEIIEFVDHIDKELEFISVEVIYPLADGSDKVMYCYNDNSIDEMDDDIDYFNDGEGEQYLYGTLWFTDGSWAEREFDELSGMEWWATIERPEKPESTVKYKVV